MKWDLTNENVLEIFTHEVAKKLKERNHKRWVLLFNKVDYHNDKLLACLKDYLWKNCRSFLKDQQSPKQAKTFPDSVESSEKICSAPSPKESII